MLRVPAAADEESAPDVEVVVEDRDSGGFRSTAATDSVGEVTEWSIDRLVGDGKYYRRDVATIAQPPASSESVE